MSHSDSGVVPSAHLRLFLDHAVVYLQTLLRMERQAQLLQLEPADQEREPDAQDKVMRGWQFPSPGDSASIGPGLHIQEKQEARGQRRHLPSSAGPQSRCERLPQEEQLLFTFSFNSMHSWVPSRASLSNQATVGSHFKPLKVYTVKKQKSNNQNY